MAHPLPNEVADIAKMGLSCQANTFSAFSVIEGTEKVVSQDAGELKQGCFGLALFDFFFFESFSV